jgi:hypothetical protein
MMVEKIEYDERVVDILKEIILENKKMLRFNINRKKFTFEQFDKLEVPDHNREHERDTTGKVYIANFEDPRLKEVVEILGATHCTNAVVYPPYSMMEWHTNNDMPGYRVYYTFSLKPAVFRYIDPHTKEMIDSPDNVGWTVRRFLVDPDAELWHTVWSENIRFAFGFMYEKGSQ